MKTPYAIISPIFFVALSILCASRAQAVTITSETEASSTTFSESLGGSGPLGGNESDWDWSIDLNHTKTTDTSVTTSPAVIDETSEVSLGLGWSGIKNWSLDGALAGSNTPQENLRTGGLSLGISYRYLYGDAKKVTSGNITKPTPNEEVDASDADDDEYSPSITMRLSGGAKNYNATFAEARTIRRANGRVITRTANSTQALNQKSAGVSVRWAPHESFRVKLAGEVFSYDKEVGTFMSQLESPLATQRGFGSMTNTIGGLPSVSYSLGFEYDFTERFSAELKETYSIIADDLSASRSTRAVLSIDLSDLWKVAMGVNVSQSNASGQDTAGIIGVEASF